MKKILEIVQKWFRHNCQNHKKLVSSNYFMCGSSGYIFSTGRDYKCNKCGKKWTDNSPDIKKSPPYF